MAKAKICLSKSYNENAVMFQNGKWFAKVYHFEIEVFQNRTLNENSRIFEEKILKKSSKLYNARLHGTLCPSFLSIWLGFLNSAFLRILSGSKINCRQGVIFFDKRDYYCFAEDHRP